MPSSLERENNEETFAGNLIIILVCRIDLFGAALYIKSSIGLPLKYSLAACQKVECIPEATRGWVAEIEPTIKTIYNQPDRDIDSL